jgi:hypothetical protein
MDHLNRAVGRSMKHFRLQLHEALSASRVETGARSRAVHYFGWDEAHTHGDALPHSTRSAQRWFVVVPNVRCSRRPTRGWSSPLQRHQTAPGDPETASTRRAVGKPRQVGSELV